MSATPTAKLAVVMTPMAASALIWVLRTVWLMSRRRQKPPHPRTQIEVPLHHIGHHRAAKDGVGQTRGRCSSCRAARCRRRSGRKAHRPTRQPLSHCGKTQIETVRSTSRSSGSVSLSIDHSTAKREKLSRRCTQMKGILFALHLRTSAAKSCSSSGVIDSPSDREATSSLPSSSFPHGPRPDPSPHPPTYGGAASDGPAACRRDQACMVPR